MASHVCVANRLRRPVPVRVQEMLVGAGHVQHRLGLSRVVLGVRVRELLTKSATAIAIFVPP